MKALEEGMPYQTLIASVLHKYVTGKLTEPKDSAPRADAMTLKKRIALRSTGHFAEIGIWPLFHPWPNRPLKIAR